MAERGGNRLATRGKRERERAADSKFKSVPICGRGARAEWRRWAAVAGDAGEGSVVGRGRRRHGEKAAMAVLAWEARGRGRADGWDRQSHLSVKGEREGCKADL